MGCSSCGSGGGLPKGCKNNGACGAGGCSPYPVFDWLSNMRMPEGQKPFDAAEVRFKNGRKEFFRIPETLKVYLGDCVAVESSPGHDIGTVSLSGELVRLQMRKKGVSQDEVLPKIYRKATERDVEIWEKARAREHDLLVQSRVVVAASGLDMKMTDVEMQGDGQKAWFYYTADERIDFRLLLRELSQKFGLKVEMRQIGARQEASRLGGIGSCGRELCCSSWLTDFRSVSTSAARYQQLALNPQKLAGQCGKLKCCLNYELDSYVDALKVFPESNKRIKTLKGDAFLMKMDIFGGFLWYAYKHDTINWIKISAADARTMFEQAQKGTVPEALESFAAAEAPVEKPVMAAIEVEDVSRFDHQKKNKRRKKKGPRKPGNRPSDAAR